MEKLKICIAYEYRGKRTEYAPLDAAGWDECTPVYLEFPGWSESPTASPNGTTAARRARLPARAGRTRRLPARDRQHRPGPRREHRAAGSVCVSHMLSALQQFADAIHEKFSSRISGEPEDQLRAPFEHLLVAVGRLIGIDVLAIGETLLDNRGGKPDFGIATDKLLCGYAELKAPGKGADPAVFTGHDKTQWERFKNLPNILYSDGREFALYRLGKQERMSAARWRYTQFGR